MSLFFLVFSMILSFLFSVSGLRGKIERAHPKQFDTHCHVHTCIRIFPTDLYGSGCADWTCGKKNKITNGIELVQKTGRNLINNITLLTAL